MLLFVFVAASQSGFSQKGAGKGDPFTDAFANPSDRSELPRVLIIGDSISIGYTPRVRKWLDGEANVHRPTTNCRWSAYGLEQVESWVGDSDWDVIHFNFGLWDWYGWAQEEKATPESYAANLEGIVKKLRARTDATLIFGVTTPPCVGPEKKAKIVITEKRAMEFNQAARAVMEKHQVTMNNLYDLMAEERETYQLGVNDVHYNDAGRDRLAARVAARIRKALPKPASGKNRPESPAGDLPN